MERPSDYMDSLILHFDLLGDAIRGGCSSLNPFSCVCVSGCHASRSWSESEPNLRFLYQPFLSCRDDTAQVLRHEAAKP
jgi:hypothetical protein